MKLCKTNGTLSPNFLDSKVRWCAFLLFAAGIPAVLATQLQAEPAKQDITDQGITTAVDRDLIQESGLDSQELDVSSSDGIVTLAGTVDNLLVKVRAIRIAESIRGVRGVIDRMTVTVLPRPDESVRKDIISALEQDPATASYKLAVTVDGPVATLTGSVSSNAEKQLAARLVMGVRGVGEVRNQIAIKYSTMRTNQEISNDITARLQWDVWIDGDLIKPIVKDGAVQLTGVIGSAISRSRAIDDAWVAGVTAVDGDKLQVEPRDSNGPHKEHEDAARSDSQIKQALQTALLLDPRVSSSLPDVTVEGGGVILAGNVGNLKAANSAVQDAKNIVGVWRVDNLLKVRPPELRTDVEMEKELKAALTWDPMLDSESISVSVKNHVARLSGSVASKFQRAEAQDVASRTKGIVSVLNTLKAEADPSNSYFVDISNDGYGEWPYYSYSTDPFYSPWVANSGLYQSRWPMSDQQIESSIRRRLFWSPFVERKDIQVSVKERVATLTGKVATRIGWSEAGKDATSGGATAVVNDIRIVQSAWWWSW
jgi:osmotically-inducible protein OsmY